MGGLTSIALAMAAMLGGGEEPRVDHVRTCETRVEGPGEAVAPDARRDVVLGRLSLLGLRGRLGIAPDGSVKVPLGLRAGPDVTLRIIPLGRTRARLDYDMRQWRDHRRLGRRVMRFESCPPETPRFDGSGPLGQVTGYNGGFRVRRRGCARLVATAPGEATVRARIALGVPPRRCR